MEGTEKSQALPPSYDQSNYGAAYPPPAETTWQQQQQPPQGAAYPPPPAGTTPQAQQQPLPGTSPPPSAHYQSAPQAPYQPPPPMGYQTQGMVVTNQPGPMIVGGQHMVVVTGAPLPNPPPDYLVFSILVILCCWPIAIPAIIYSVGSRNAARRGDQATALAKGQTAKTLCIAALVTGIVLISINILVRVILAVVVYN